MTARSREQHERRLSWSLAGFLIVSSVVVSVSGRRVPGHPVASGHDEQTSTPGPVHVVATLLGAVCLVTTIVAAASFFRLIPCSRVPMEVAGGMNISLRVRQNSRWCFHPADSDSAAADAQVRSSVQQLGCGKAAWEATMPMPSQPSALPHGISGRQLALREFEYKVLYKATSGFHRKWRIGDGAAGAVFRGSVLGHDGLQTLVAIKRFHREVRKKMVEHVLSDLAGQPLRHRNLVYLIGYCLKKRKLYLVYDYMENGNLEEHLFNTKAAEGHVLSWSHRVKIIRGVALGLLHLHRNGSVHGSVKATNVFLEQDDFTPRLGDFGYSRVETSKAASLRNCRATYAPPEAGGWLVPSCSDAAMTTSTTYEADVFYFGALVLEVVCGRRCCGGDFPDGSKFLVDWVWSLHAGRRIVDAVDAALLADGGGDLIRAEAEKLLLVGLACSRPNPSQRPKMDAVVKIIQNDRMPPPEVPLTKPKYVPPVLPEQ